nr:TolC family protein [Sphingomonas kyeonggiensis]
MLIALAASLAGCQHYTSLPLQTDASLAPSLAAIPDLPARALTVSEVATLAVTRNPDLLAVRAKAGVAEAQLVQAGVLPNPSLSGAILPLLSGAGSVSGWNLGLSQDIKALIVLKPRRRSARDSLNQVHADLLWQEWQVAGQARQLAGDIVLGERLRPMLEQAYELMAKRYTANRKALESGNSTLSTLAPSAGALQAARAAMLQQDQAQLANRHKLNALLGIAPDVTLPLADAIDLPAFDPREIRSMLATLPQRRPDLLALRAGYAAQDEQLRVAILSQFPDLILGASASSDNSKVISGGPNVQLGLPVFDRNQGNIAIARATRQQLNREYAARLDAVTGEVGALLSERDQIALQLAAARHDLDDSRAFADRAAKAFAASMLDERSFVDLLSNRFSKEQEVMTLELALFDRQVAIQTLIGTGLPAVDTLGFPDPGADGAAK